MKRELVDDLRAVWKVSIRRACSVLCFQRSSCHYKSCRAPQASLMTRIREIAQTRVRYGYRRIHVLLRREGWDVNHKRVFRLYRAMGLQLRNKSPKRKVKGRAQRSSLGTNAFKRCLGDGFCPRPALRRPPHSHPDHHLRQTERRRHTFTRYVPAIEIRERFTGADVVAVLEEVCKEFGFPRSIRIDQGPEFISKDLDLWAYARGV